MCPREKGATSLDAGVKSGFWCLCISAADFDNACDRAAAGAQLYCVAVVSTEWLCGVSIRKDHWGSGGPSVVVRVVESVVRASGAQGHVVGKYGVVI